MLLLSRADVIRLMDFPAYVTAVEAGFRAAAIGSALAPPAAAFHVPGGSYHAKAAARDHTSRHSDLMAGATWRDPDRVEEWIVELTPNKPVAVYCAYGFDIGRNVTKTLIERGIDARFVRAGVSAWYAAGGARALKPTAS